MRWILALVMISSVLAYSVVDYNMGLDQNCEQEITELFTGEEYWLCVEFMDSAMPLQYEGVTAWEDSIMQEQNYQVKSDGKAAFRGKANTQTHKVYYVKMQIKEETLEIPIEVKNKCVQLPPSTVQAIPNVVKPGETFRIEVSNAEKDFDMTVIGLTNVIHAKISKGEEWTKEVASIECSETGGKCTLQFTFTDSKHTICKSDATKIEVRVREAGEGEEIKTEDTTVMLVGVLIVIIIGTAFAVVLNRYL